MSENVTNLTIIARNAAPQRQAHYSCIWMVYSGGQAITIHVAYDRASHPYVEDRCAA